MIGTGSLPRCFVATLSLVALASFSINDADAKPPVRKPIARTAKTKKIAAKPVKVAVAKPVKSAKPTKFVKPKVRILPVGFNVPPPPSSLTAMTSGTVDIVAAGKGRINYEVGIVKAVGLGAVGRPSLKKSRAQDVLEAREAAIADALRILGMTVSEVRVTSDTRVRNFVLVRDDIRVKVNAFLSSAEIVEEKLIGEVGIYRIVVQAHLTGPGSLMEAIAPVIKDTQIAAEKPTTPPLASPVPNPEPKPDPLAPGMPAPDGAEYTSLIVDCRGLNIVASMSPKLYAADGTEVYGTMRISPDYVNEVGIVSFPRSMDAARHVPRAGSHPLIVRGIRSADRHRFHVMISKRDAECARDANESGHFFERTAVIFLVDPL